jgi:uncharacterized protein with HEPN domain
MRYERLVDILMGRIMKVLLLILEGNTDGTLRDRFLILEKHELIRNVEVWMSIKEMRNEIVHEYLDGNEIVHIYDDITHECADEIQFFLDAIAKRFIP